MKKEFLLITFIFLISLNINSQDIDEVISKYDHVFEWVIKPNYDMIKNIPDNNILTASKDDKFGYITLEEEILVPYQWGEASVAYNCGVGIVAKKEDKFVYLIDIQNKGEKILEDCYPFIGDFIDGYSYLSMPRNFKCYIIDSKGKIVLDKPFVEINLPSNIKDIIEGKSNDYIPAKEDKHNMGFYGYVNAKGEWMNDPVYVITSPRSGNFYPVMKTFFKNDKGMFDSELKQIIPFDYHQLIIIDDNYIKARKKGEKWGVLNTKNEVVIPFEYDLIGPFDENGKAYFEKGKEYGYLYLEGAKVEVKGMLDRKPIKLYYGLTEEGRLGTFTFEDPDDSAPLGITRFKNGKLNIEIPQKYATVNYHYIGNNLYIVVGQKFGKKEYYGLLNEKLEMIIDPALKEFEYIGVPNTPGYLPVGIDEKYGVAKFKPF